MGATSSSSGYEHGWFQVAFERELTDTLSPAALGARRLLLLRDGGATRAFDADCPHRGANLAVGGRLDGDEHVVCPFHGYRIRLGRRDDVALCVREYATTSVGGMVFVRLSEGHDNGWTALLETLATDHTFVAGFAMDVRAPAETVIENGFDRRHFDAVHGVGTAPFAVERDERGALSVRSRFSFPQTERLRGRADDGSVGFEVVVPSPGLAAVTLEGPTGYTIVTGATPVDAGNCVVRITLALPAAVWGASPAPERYAFLLQHSRRGLDDDARVWANLSPTATPHLMPEDEPILRFHAFCAPFRSEASG